MKKGKIALCLLSVVMSVGTIVTPVISSAPLAVAGNKMPHMEPEKWSTGYYQDEIERAIKESKRCEYGCKQTGVDKPTSGQKQENHRVDNSQPSNGYSSYPSSYPSGGYTNYPSTYPSSDSSYPSQPHEEPVVNNTVTLKNGFVVRVNSNSWSSKIQVESIKNDTIKNEYESIKSLLGFLDYNFIQAISRYNIDLVDWRDNVSSDNMHHSIYAKYIEHYYIVWIADNFKEKEFKEAIDYLSLVISGRNNSQYSNEDTY